MNYARVTVESYRPHPPCQFASFRRNPAENGDGFSGAVAQDRHSGRGPGICADGRTRYSKYGTVFGPLNLWAISDANRLANTTNY